MKTETRFASKTFHVRYWWSGGILKNRTFLWWISEKFGYFSSVWAWVESSTNFVLAKVNFVTFSANMIEFGVVVQPVCQDYRYKVTCNRKFLVIPRTRTTNVMTDHTLSLSASQEQFMRRSNRYSHATGISITFEKSPDWLGCNCDYHITRKFPAINASFRIYVVVGGF